MKTLWTFEFPVEIKAPVVADLDGDGKMEILVSGANGKLYMLGETKSASAIGGGRN